MADRVTPLTRNQLAQFLPNHETIKVFENLQSLVFSILPSRIDDKVDKNPNITAGTNTKITYDEKGLVTAGTAATTADINDTAARRYVNDALLALFAFITKITTGSNANGYWLKITDKDDVVMVVIQSRFNFTFSSATMTIDWPISFPDANYTVIGAPESNNVVYGAPVGITKTATQCDITTLTGSVGGYVGLWLKT